MEDAQVKLAVVTGGHGFEVVRFHQLFRSLPETDAYIQHMDDFASSSEETRDEYDVVLFYIMLMEGPADEGLPWYAGKPGAVLEYLGQTGQGIVVLHHALLAYPEWPAWSEIVGVRDRGFGFDIGQTIRVEVAAPEHPIVRGMAAWEMGDETYTMNEPGADSEVLLTVDHPRSMRNIAWARQYGKSRVFCLQSGHDHVTYEVPQFRQVLQRGILWAAGRLG